MSKSVYSLVLSDDVVRAVDVLAYRNNTSRSNMINQLLAQQISFVTPEQRMREIFRRVEDLLGGNQVFCIQNGSSNSALNLRSALLYKYNPTVRYTVEIGDNGDGSIGCLRVFLRTQNAALLTMISQFFRLWLSTEAAERGESFEDFCREYACGLSAGQMQRSLRPSTGEELSPETLANAIYAYLAVCDETMKLYFADSDAATALGKIRARYRRYLSEQQFLL